MSCFCILCIYRPPTSNFFNFLCLLESILMQLYSNTTNLFIRGDININYLKSSNSKTQLDKWKVFFVSQSIYVMSLLKEVIQLQGQRLTYLQYTKFNGFPLSCMQFCWYVSALDDVKLWQSSNALSELCQFKRSHTSKKQFELDKRKKKRKLSINWFQWYKLFPFGFF